MEGCLKLFLKFKQLKILVVAGTVAILCGGFFSVVARADVQAPVIKWQQGGCYNSWCETGWYSSPAVADLDGDGAIEVIGAAYTVFVLNGDTGALIDSLDPVGGRSWPGVVVVDVDADETLEIVTAHGQGYVHVFNWDPNTDTLTTAWSQRPTTSELRGLAVADLDDDGTLEIVVSAAVASKTNTWVFEHDGSLRSGWPQLGNDSGYAAGVYNDNVALGDMDGNGTGEIVVPSDVHYICTYNPAGLQLQANSLYGDKKWGKVGVWEDYAVEIRGWGECNGIRAESYRTNFADGPAVISDVNGDSTLEVVVTGNVYDCHAGYPPSQYNGVYIFNADRSRFNSGSYNWQTVPIDTGAPLVENYNIIESVQPNAAVADLDGDGEKEIIYSSYDGQVHAFWLDQAEHHNWPFSVYSSAEGAYRFASEPVVADIDNDGTAEVIVGSWVQKETNKTGKLHIIDYQGNPLYQINLPDAFGSPDWNGALAAPTLANIDNDTDLEVVLNTAHSGFVAYDLPGSAGARILWGTGRGNELRNGAILPGDINFNGKVGLEDVIMALKIGAGMITDKAVQIAADVNADGKIGIAEAIYGLQKVSAIR